MAGIILYKGPSQIDGAPIVVIATGTDGKFQNRKTGAMVQTWILREDIHPMEAIKTGQGSTICGNCIHRGNDGRNRSCYVRVGNAPSVVWKAYKRGIYPMASPEQAANMLSGFKVRLGAYGDPAAVPFEVWESALVRVSGHTGYTHQWLDCDSRFARIVMASVDSQAERVMSGLLGYRSFRVRVESDYVNSDEVICPASEEAGHKTTCSACVACGGNDAKAKAGIVIQAHGNGARYVTA